MVKITNNSYMEIKSHCDDVLNKDRPSFTSSNGVIWNYHILI